jgi:alkylhydroperoxidase family enzyme
LRNLETSALSEKEKVLFRFVAKVNAESVTIGLADIEALHDSGWNDEAIYDAVTVCALFNFYNRWIDASGVHPMTKEQHKAAAPRMAGGYIRTPGSQDR